MIQLLPEDRWPEIAETLKTEFDAELPFKDKSSIIADIEDNEIKGFVVAEYLLRIGQIWSKKGNPRGLIKYLEQNMAANTSVIVIASDERFHGLCKKFDMREVEGTVFRRDF